MMPFRVAVASSCGRRSRCSFAVLTVAVLLLAGPPTARADWIVPPAVFNAPFGPAGPNGIPGDFDDPVPNPGEIFFVGIHSGYAGGLYNRDPGRYPGEPGGPPALTAAAELNSQVFQIDAVTFRYRWELTNTGSGDLFLYFDTNGPRLPNFITVVNNFGDPELDGSAFPPVDLSVAESFEVQGQEGGPPVTAFWGGGWNPSTDTDAMFFQPIPEPGSLFLFGSAVVAAARRFRKRAAR